LPTAFLASCSRLLELGAGVITIINTTFDLKTKMPAELPAAVVVLNSTALSPIPETGFAFVTVEPLLKLAAICSGKTASAVVVSG